MHITENNNSIPNSAISSTTVYVETLTVGCDDDVLILVDNFFTLKFSLFFTHNHSYYSTWVGHPCEAFVIPFIILLFFTFLLSPPFKLGIWLYPTCKRSRYVQWNCLHKHLNKEIKGNWAWCWLTSKWGDGG